MSYEFLITVGHGDRTVHIPDYHFADCEENIPWAHVNCRSQPKNMFLAYIWLQPSGLQPVYRRIPRLPWRSLFNPLSPNSDNINCLLTISIHCQEIRLWELITWSPKRKCFDLLSNSLNLFFKEMYRDQFGEFACGYWGFQNLYGMVWTPIRYVIFHFRDRRGAAQLRFVTETAPPQPFLCVKSSPIRYDFRSGAKAICYSLNTA